MFELYKSLGKTGRLTRRELRRLARLVLEEYVKRCGDAVGVVDRPGFEPGASAVRGRRSSRLSYRPTRESPVIV